MVSGISVTIYVHGRAYGVLGAHTVKKRAFTEDEVLFLQEVADVLPALADVCFVDVVEETEGSVTRFAVAHSEPEGEALTRELRGSYRFDPSRPHGTARVYRSGAPELIPEVNEEILRDIARSPEHLGVLRRFHPGSYICVPLRITGRTLGAMGLLSSGLGRYEADDVALAEGLAHCTALALDNARRHVSEAELVRELIRRAREEEQVVTSPKQREVPSITPRQMEVLKLLAAGRSTREIGGELYLSEATVRNHIRGLLQAFGAHSQLEVLSRARELGVLP